MKKTFKDLEFRLHPHPTVSGMVATHFFDNGYGVSVIRFKLFDGTYASYTDNEEEWEIAVLKGTETGSYLCSTTPVTDDASVIGHLSADEVSEYMLKIQELPEVHDEKA